MKQEFWRSPVWYSLMLVATTWGRFADWFADRLFNR